MQVCPDLGHLVSLRTLLPHAEFLGRDDIAIAGCTCDSRQVEPGQLFVALAGSHRDGHAFIAEAAAQGCAAVLCERPPADLAIPCCVVPDAREAYGQLCQALAGNPSQQLKVIGVTGTNGKTTTSCLIASILTSAGYSPGLLGTLGYLDGRKIERSTWTTPPADVLATWFSRMVANECTHAVMEVSSHALVQGRVAGVRFDAACVTNVTRDHLDYHGSLRKYRLAKARLFEQLPAEGFAVINADDPVATDYLRQIDGPVLTVGINAAAEIVATPIEQFQSEQTFLITAGSETVPVRTQMIGTHHIYNCLVATAVGLTYGIDLPTVVRGLEEAGHVPGRLERVECGQPYGVFVDYAHTPDALRSSLAALRQVTSGRLICVFGAGGNRDQQKRPLMGQAVEALADVAVVTSDNPRFEDPQAIVDDILLGFRRPASACVVLDREEAVREALAMAQPGDCVIIAGKGHETYQTIGDQKLPMDDRQIAQDWLYRVRPYAPEMTQ